MSEQNDQSVASKQPKKNSWYKNWVGWFVFVIVLCFVGYNAYVRVPAKHAGVPDFQGKTREVYMSGPHAKIPFFEKVVLYDIGMRCFNYSTGGDSLKTKTLVKMKKFSATVQYNLVGSNVDRLYNFVGTADDFEKKVLEPVVAGAVHQVIGEYDPEYLVYMQNLVKEGLLEIINNEIKQTGLAEISSLQLKGFKFDDKFEEATLDLEVAKKHAEQIEIEAKAKAEALGLESDAIKNPVYINYLYAKAFGNWHGDVPSTLMLGNEALAVVPGGVKK